MFDPTHAVLLWALVKPLIAHTWVEQLTIASDVAFQSPGFPRGNVFRTDPTFNDFTMTWLLPPDGRATLLSTDRICMPGQEDYNQTQDSPMLPVATGQQVVLRYQENGHATIPWLSPFKPSPGKVYVYGTTDSQPEDALLSIHGVWNEQGDGGDGRGRLLTVQPFDDGECYSPTRTYVAQDRAGKFSPDPHQGPNRWCKTVVNMPSDIQGRYTLYWVWDWPSTADPSNSAAGGKTEIYTTCMDVELQVTIEQE